MAVFQVEDPSDFAHQTIHVLCCELLSPSGFLLNNIETSSDRSREFPDISCCSVADGSATDSRFSSKELDEDFVKDSSSSSSETIARCGRIRSF